MKTFKTFLDEAFSRRGYGWSSAVPRVWEIAKNRDPDIAGTILTDPSILDSIHIAQRQGILTSLTRHPSPEIAVAAMQFPSTKKEKIDETIKSASKERLLSLLQTPNINTDTVNLLARHQSPEIALSALNHPLANFTTNLIATNHPHPEVSDAAQTHPTGYDPKYR